MTKTLYIFILSGFLIGCNSSSQESKNKTKLPKVVATTGMLYDAALSIGGDSIKAEAIMGPGVDPHLYKATQGDLSRLKSADLIIYNGILLEGKMSEVLGKMQREKPVIAAAEIIPDSLLIRHSDYGNAFDPHVWFDVTLWKYVADEIGNALITLDSSNKSYYLKNLAKYQSSLDSLDGYVRDRINEIPNDQKVLITAHDAFGYFGKAYGLRVEAVQGMSTVADFGLKDIADLIDLIIEHNIKAIFVETSVSSKSIKAVIAGCKEQGHDLKIGGYLYSDAMGNIGTKEGTYIGMFQKNVNTIVDALK